MYAGESSVNKASGAYAYVPDVGFRIVGLRFLQKCFSFFTMRKKTLALTHTIVSQLIHTVRWGELGRWA